MNAPRYETTKKAGRDSIQETHSGLGASSVQPFILGNFMNSPKFVQLEPAAFLTDVDFMAMDTSQRGVYCSLIFLLYCNNGKLKFNSPPNSRDIGVLCGQTDPIHEPEFFKEGVEIVLRKFQFDGEYLTHKRVSAELQKVVDFQQYGRLGAEKRWKLDDAPPNSPPNGNVSKVKVSKDNINKDKYLEYVYLSKEEYQKLLTTFGEVSLKDRLAALDDYLGQSAKNRRKYDSHYRTILAWARKDGNKSLPARKPQLLPIVGKTCSTLNCKLPAVYKRTGSEYDSYCCVNHLPKVVKEMYY